MKTKTKLLILAPTIIAAVFTFCSVTPNSRGIIESFAKVANSESVKLDEILPKNAVEVCAINAEEMFNKSTPKWAAQALWRKKLTISDGDFHTWSIVWRDSEFRAYAVEIPLKTFPVAHFSRESSARSQVLCASVKRALLRRVSPDIQNYYLVLQ